MYLNNFLCLQACLELMNKKIWSKGKLKQGVICLGDIFLRTEFP